MGWKEKWRGKEGVEGKGKEEEGEQKELLQLFMKRREFDGRKGERGLGREWIDGMGKGSESQ